MKITDVVLTHVKIPLFYPVKWSGGTRYSAPAIVIQIKTDEGIVGLGEAVGPTVATVKTILEEELKQFLIGKDPMRTEWLIRRMEEFSRNWYHIAAYAISGIEIALYDIKAKALNAPVYQLLGGKCKSEISYAGYLFIDTPENNAKKALDYVNRGYRELKLKVGRNLSQDIESLEAIRDKVGKDIKIRIDANMNWSVPTAIKWIKAVRRFDIQYVEQPVPDFDPEGMAAVRKAVDVPIAADEGCTTIQSVMELIKHESCDVFVVYISEAGGLSRAKQIVSLADACGKWCSVGTWAETGIATIAGAHLIASSANFPFANDTHYMLQTKDILKKELEIVDGSIKIPDLPGLGVEIDDDKLMELSKSDVRESVFFDNVEDENMPMVGQII